VNGADRETSSSAMVSPLIDKLRLVPHLYTLAAKSIFHEAVGDIEKRESDRNYVASETVQVPR